MSRSVQSFIIDSFTAEPFKGNPAAVCLLDSPLSATQMLLTAQEFGLSETAFVTEIGAGQGAEKGAGRYNIRYFSPKMEVDICGHATLAAAKALFSERKDVNTAAFTTHKGVTLKAQRAGTEIVMQFPVYDVVPAEVPRAMLDALGLHTVLRTSYSPDIHSLLIEIDSAEALAGLRPNFAALLASYDDIHGVCVTALSNDPEFDFESRYFWPWSGTDEDPVTGAMHCVLTPYWGAKLGLRKMRARQCSQRGGFMAVELMASGELLIRAEAQIILKGELFI